MKSTDSKIVLGKEFINYILELSILKQSFFNGNGLRYLMRAVMAGILVALGYVIIVLLDANFAQIKLLGDNSLQGIGHFIGGWVFGFVLIFIYYTKSELLTSNMMIVSVAKYYNKITVGKATKILLYCYLGNLIGGILVGLLLSQTSVISGNAGALDSMNQMLSSKLAYVGGGDATMTVQSLWDLFVRAIFCNFFINISMLMVYSGYVKGDAAKMLVLFGGVFFFYYLGLEHSIANTCFFAVAAFTPGSVFEFIPAVLNIIVALIGNFIGGGLLVGVYYAFLNDEKRVQKNEQKNSKK